MKNKSHRKLSRAAFTVLIAAVWAGVSGCQSPKANAPSAPPSASSPQAAQTNAAGSTPAVSLVLREGDTIRITFPGAHTLDSVQRIRRDGKITLEQVGEIQGEMTAAGLTVPELEQQLLAKYGPQLVNKEVSVTVESSEFVIYVSGAVMRPGKIIADHPLTPLEAVLEAGLDKNRSNLRKVVVIRENANGKTEKFTINVKDMMDAKPAPPFILKPLDKMFVPEKFNLF
jgi:protein involved in polysaccharide export with SLBB domain